MTGTVLGTATDLVQNIASQSSDLVSNFVFDNTIGNIIKQVDKLAPAEQEKIKEQICK